MRVSNHRRQSGQSIDENIASVRDMPELQTFEFIGQTEQTTIIWHDFLISRHPLLERLMHQQIGITEHNQVLYLHLQCHF